MVEVSLQAIAGLREGPASGEEHHANQGVDQIKHRGSTSLPRKSPDAREDSQDLELPDRMGRSREFGRFRPDIEGGAWPAGPLDGSSWTIHMVPAHP